jgi:hypothetical protein
MLRNLSDGPGTSDTQTSLAERGERTSVSLGFLPQGRVPFQGNKLPPFRWCDLP